MLIQIKEYWVFVSQANSYFEEEILKFQLQKSKCSVAFLKITWLNTAFPA